MDRVATVSGTTNLLDILDRVLDKHDFATRKAAMHDERFAVEHELSQGDHPGLGDNRRRSAHRSTARESGQTRSDFEVVSRRSTTGE